MDDVVRDRGRGSVGDVVAVQLQFVESSPERASEAVGDSRGFERLGQLTSESLLPRATTPEGVQNPGRWPPPPAAATKVFH